MKIDLNYIDREHFSLDEHIILSTGESIFLVQPNSKVEGLVWTSKNRHFRSSIYNTHGELISAGFPKFTSWGENEAEFPTPKTMDDVAMINEKMDGICLIISQYRGHRFIRTRGILDAESLPGADEIRHFRNTVIHRIGDYFYTNKSWTYSFIFEWISPNNQVVIKYDGKPHFYLVGAINHKDYTLWSPKDLDAFAGGIGLLRPTVYGANSLSYLLEDVAKWENREGVVITSQNGQMQHKVHSKWYIEKATKLAMEGKLF